jgi:hypothetical protein
MPILSHLWSGEMTVAQKHAKTHKDAGDSAIL